VLRPDAGVTMTTALAALLFLIGLPAIAAAWLV
jgi:hypothetical protein